MNAGDKFNESEGQTRARWNNYNSGTVAPTGVDIPIIENDDTGIAMTEITDWLRARVGGFAQLARAELDAISDFALLWGLFESRILNKRGNATAIVSAVTRWQTIGVLDPTILNEELAYFQQRYHDGQDFTHHFYGLLLRGPDHTPMMKRVLSGVEADPVARISAALIVVLRYRNNLFHGEKWDDVLAGQFDNFTHANRVLRKILDRYGNL